MSAKFTIDELLTCTSAKLKLKACAQHMNWTELAWPSYKRVHWSRTRHLHDSTGGHETRTVGAESIGPERKCAPMQLSQCWFPFPIVKYKNIFYIKYTEAVLSNSTRKLLRSEITKIFLPVVTFSLIVSACLQFLETYGTLNLSLLKTTNRKKT